MKRIPLARQSLTFALLLELSFGLIPTPDSPNCVSLFYRGSCP